MIGTMARLRDKTTHGELLRYRGYTPRNDSPTWKKRVKRERKRLERDPSLAVCWICGEPIDMQLPPLHARGFSLDHLVPVSRGGAIDGQALPAHRGCNSSRGDGTKRMKDKPKTIVEW